MALEFIPTLGWENSRRTTERNLALLGELQRQLAGHPLPPTEECISITRKDNQDVELLLFRYAP